MKKEVSLKKEQKAFSRAIRLNAGSISTNLLTGQDMWDERISKALVDAAGYHVTMFEAIFREEFKKAILNNPKDPNTDVAVDTFYIMDKIFKALSVFDMGEMLFRPEGQLKEGETLDYELYHV